MKKQILTLAILATLPLTANATGNHIGPNGGFDDDYENVEMATHAPYYEKMTIRNDDRQHIASTAYVKGAYNDAIAALNKTAYDIFNYKQDTLYKISDNGSINPEVIDKQAFIDSYILDPNSGDQSGSGWDMSLVTAAGVAKLVNIQRATVYTTWDNDNATKQVAFVTASAQGQ